MKKPSPSKVFSRPSTTTVAPLTGGALDVGGDAVTRLGGDERAHRGGFVGAVADGELLHALGDLLDERVGHLANGDEDGDRHAALARGAVRGGDGGVSGAVEFGVGHDDHVVLRAAECLNPLALARCSLVDVLGDGGGADEGDGRDVVVVEDAVDGFLVTVDDVEHAVGKTGFAERLG